MLSVLGLSVVPNETVGTPNVEAANGDKDLRAGQIGGAFLGEQADAIDSTVPLPASAGLEFDTSKVTRLPVERARVMGRYLAGEGLTGFAPGVGFTF